MFEGTSGIFVAALGLAYIRFAAVFRQYTSIIFSNLKKAFTFIPFKVNKIHSWFFFLLLINLPVYAQRSLSQSRQTSLYTYIYPISEFDLESLYKGTELDENVLTAPIDSFLTTSGKEPALPQGNYLKVYVEKNTLKYSLIENRSAHLKLLNNRKDLQFIIVDKWGNEIKSAKISKNGKAISYDNEAGLYRSRYPRKEATLIKVHHNGVANFSEVYFDDEREKRSALGNWLLHKSPAKFVYPRLVRLFYKIKKDNVPYKYQSYTVKKSNKKGVFSGYMVFNKPMYKPFDTVRLKAFILKGKRRSLATEELSVRLINNTESKYLGKIKPESKASYDFKFFLHDTLKLDLDKNYTVELYQNDKVYSSGVFRYEDYELKSVSFSIRGDKVEHTTHQPQSLYFKATDENGLNVMDGRVNLMIRTNSITSFHKERLFIPDTLWKHSLKLDALGETKLVLPDSIFPEADISYSAEAVFLNSNNENREARAQFSFYSEAKDDLSFELREDSVHISFKDPVRKDISQVKISAINGNGDTLEIFKKALPTTIKVNPYAAEYEVEGEIVLDWFDVTETGGDITASAQRTADSLFVKVDNPRKLPFWFTILHENKVLDRGKCLELDYRKPFRGKGRTTFRLSYVWADQSLEKSVDAHFAEKELHLDVSQPLTISPGEKAEIEVKVTDAKGNAVGNANLTAYSITSKFNYQGPSIPYFGKSYVRSKQQPNLELDEGIGNRSVPLNWKRWSGQLGLDSIQYFRFTHPVTEYRHAEPSPDGLTQIAPFVVEKGNIVPVEVLYLNEKPVYFSQAQQMERYSFIVNSGSVRIKFRLKDKVVLAENVNVVKGEKLVISYNLDTIINKSIKVTGAPPALSEYEASVLNKYMIQVADTYSPRFATIKQPDRIFLLKSSDEIGSYSRQPKLVGPLSYNLGEFQIKDTDPVFFEAEPNYSYTFRPGLIRQRSITDRYPFKTILNTASPQDFRDHVLTNKEVDSLWLHYLDLRSNTTWIFFNPFINSKGNGRLEIKVKAAKEQQPAPLIKNILIYSYDNPDFLNIYPGRETDMGYLVPGRYRLFVLLKGDSYVLVEDIVVKPDGRNFIQIGLDKPIAKDSVSTQISNFIKERSIAQRWDEKPAIDLIKESFNSRYSNSADYKNVMAGTVFSASDKEPLPGVSVVVKGTQFGVTTDIDGKFRINVPYRGKLTFGFIGFESKEINITRSVTDTIYLEESSQALQEVVVGYGSEEKGRIEQSLKGAVYGLSAEKVSANVLNIRGVNAPGNAGPLYIVDGIPLEGPVMEYPADQIADISTLKDAAATALYGARGANGVIIITTKKGKGKAQPDAAEGAGPGGMSIRKNFSDYAFWQPQLKTDVNGKAKFDVTFPDDITNWRTFFIAMSAKEQSGYSEKSIKAFRSISAGFVSPQFAVEGDTFKPVGKVMNYTTEEVSLHRDFSYNGQRIDSGPLTVKNSHIDTFQVVAGPADSLKFVYSIKKQNGYSDGEERSVPVIKAGIQETIGRFEALEGDTSLSLSFNPALGRVTFRADASLIPVLLAETEHLHRYEYMCNEQLASKLKALLAQRRIKNYLNEPFENDKVVRQLIEKLDDGRRKDGTWGWWKNTNPELWISRHVIEAFIDAETAGYSIPIKSLEMIDYLVYQLSTYKGWDRLEAMLLLHKLNAKIDFASSIEAYEKELKASKSKPALHEKLKLMLLKQRLGLPVTIDSSASYKHSTMFGNIYFGDNNFRMFDNSIQNTLLAYMIIKADGKHAEWLSKIRNFLLEQRQDGYWRNTYESALILETILPDLLTGSQKPNPTELTLTTGKSEQIKKFPYTTTLDSNARLLLQKRGDLPLYITAYQQFWNSKPEKISKNFRVDTWFESNQSKVTFLKGGQAVVLQAEVTTSADADFVMVEIPIPAGCSYDEKEQAWWGNEVHREYAKNKVSIFCRKLKKGAFTFSVKLMPRYDGNYTLNPAKAELMYFPSFYGREGIKKVDIGGRVEDFDL